MVKSGMDTLFAFPVEPRRTIAAGEKPPSPERTLEAGRAKIRLWNAWAYRGAPGERQGRGGADTPSPALGKKAPRSAGRVSSRDFHPYGGPCPPLSREDRDTG